MVGFQSLSIGKVVVYSGTALWYCTFSLVLCWYGQTYLKHRDTVSVSLPRTSCVGEHSAPPPRRLDRLAPYCSRLYAHPQTSAPF